MDTNGNRMVQSMGFQCSQTLAQRIEVINGLSHASVKVRHWLLTNEIFKTGLEALNPDSLTWIADDRVRGLVKLGLLRMIDNAVGFASIFPDLKD